MNVDVQTAPSSNTTGIKWKNPKAKAGHAYLPTAIEHIANIGTHVIPIIPSIVGLVLMVQRSVLVPQVIASVIYGTSLILLFSVSSIFHYLSYTGIHRQLRYYFHLADRAVIYVFIASSYTPWLTLKHFSDHTQGVFMLWVVWISAALGMFYQLTFHERYKRIEIVLYLMVGVCPAVVAADMEDQRGVMELATGGFFYIFGVIFFKCDGCVPCAHAIWHLFVAAGAYTHYGAISKYCLGSIHEYYMSSPVV